MKPPSISASLLLLQSILSFFTRPILFPDTRAREISRPRENMNITAPPRALEYDILICLNWPPLRFLPIDSRHRGLALETRNSAPRFHQTRVAELRARNYFVQSTVAAGVGRVRVNNNNLHVRYLSRFVRGLKQASNNNNAHCLPSV